MNHRLQDLLTLAHEIALEAYRGHIIGSSGLPLLLLYEGAANRLKGDFEAQIIALLNEVTRRSKISLSGLEQRGIPSELTQAIEQIVQTSDEPTKDYLDRIAQDPTLSKVVVAIALSKQEFDPSGRNTAEAAEIIYRLGKD